jgi:hypothetical protein
MIQINNPELEALIQQRLVEFGFDTVEELLLYVLKSAPMPTVPRPSKRPLPQAD